MTPTLKVLLWGGHGQSMPHQETALLVGLLFWPRTRRSAMKIITVSREYGAGGGEVARRLAETLDWELLDRDLLHQAAALEHVPDEELERLDEKAVSVADRFRLHPSHEHYL